MYVKMYSHFLYRKRRDLFAIVQMLVIPEFIIFSSDFDFQQLIEKRFFVLTRLLQKYLYYMLGFTKLLRHSSANKKLLQFEKAVELLNCQDNIAPGFCSNRTRCFLSSNTLRHFYVLLCCVRKFVSVD